MHVRERIGKRIGRNQSQIGWYLESRQRRMNMLGELNQLHMSVGKCHHFARSFKGHDKHWK
ncbi:MAG: hypothetical protein COS89_04675 [Deltaproteobacteria bacterium CG07_land_8_20_14_0_80_38_7]|nr:MAG: hypothetical protein COS89_04675 [Deltaproteobacteria bacterium CG07_land_8_20_14_0_80_38_7]